MMRTARVSHARNRARMFVAAVALGLAGLVPAGSGLAHTSQAAGLQVIHPWTEPGEQGTTSKAYPTFVNRSDSRQVITGISTGVAERVENVARGEAVERLELAPGETLGVDQFHLRLVELTRELEDGGHFGVRLTFADGRTAEIMMVVGESTQAPDM